MYEYNPPASGCIAPNSAYVNAPRNDNTPPTTQTSNATPTHDSVWRSTTPGTRKIPEPITVPKVSMTRSVKPSVRRSVVVVSVTSKLRTRLDGEHHTATWTFVSRKTSVRV